MNIDSKKIAKTLRSSRMEIVDNFIIQLIAVDKLVINEAIKNTKQNYSINFEWDNRDFIYMLFINHVENIYEDDVLSWEWTVDEDTWEEYIVTSEYNNYKDILYKFFWELNSIVSSQWYYQTMTWYENVLSNFKVPFKKILNLELWIGAEWFHKVTWWLFIPLDNIKELNAMPIKTDFKEFAKMKFQNNIISITINWKTLDYILANIKSSDIKKWLVLLWVIYNMWEREDFLDYKSAYEDIMKPRISIKSKTFLKYNTRVNHVLKNILWLDYCVRNKYSNLYAIEKI